jgi:hypothetical protein
MLLGDWLLLESTEGEARWQQACCNHVFIVGIIAIERLYSSQTNSARMAVVGRAVIAGAFKVPSFTDAWICLRVPIDNRYSLMSRETVR